MRELGESEWGPNKLVVEGHGNNREKKKNISRWPGTNAPGGHGEREATLRL